MRTIATSAAIRTEFDIQFNRYKTIATTTIFGQEVKLSFWHCESLSGDSYAFAVHSVMRIASLLDRLINEETYHTINSYDILLAEVRSVSVHYVSRITMNGVGLTPSALCDFVIEHGDPEARVVVLEKLKDLGGMSNGGMVL